MRRAFCRFSKRLKKGNMRILFRNCHHFIATNRILSSSIIPNEYGWPRCVEEKWLLLQWWHRKCPSHSVVNRQFLGHFEVQINFPSNKIQSFQIYLSFFRLFNDPIIQLYDFLILQLFNFSIFRFFDFRNCRYFNFYKRCPEISKNPTLCVVRL